MYRKDLASMAVIALKRATNPLTNRLDARQMMMNTLNDREGQAVPNVTFRTRDDAGWQDVTTQALFEGKTVVRLEYDSYIPMALQQLQVIINNARERWELSHVALAHRLGEVAVKQTSVVCMLYIYI